jgi:DNA-binding NtrC family response regulator
MILVVDDLAEIASEHAEMLTALGFENEVITNPFDVMDFLRREKSVDLVCLDLRMPGLGGQDLMRQINEFNPSIGVIIATVVNDVREAVKSIRSGAYNYLLKPLQPESLYKTVNSFYGNRPLNISGDPRFSSFITRSERLKDVFSRVSVFANSDLPVLVMGETGTGKDLVARLIHSLSSRNGKVYLPVNISSLKGDLFQSEMFGHVRGSFTGADKSRKGFFAEADGGTLFIDEIGELPLGQQKDLLRVLQDGSYFPVGSSASLQTNCRLIFATNRNLREEVKCGRFREDLYYRICHAAVSIPPLRERTEDIECLGDYFLKKYCSQHGRLISSISPHAMGLLKGYSFPGNVRELEGMMNVAVMLESSSQLRSSHLPEYLTEKKVDESILLPDCDMNLNAVRKRTILHALKLSDQNQSKAAERLGISRSTLHRFLNEIET